jgi:integrase
LATADQPEPKKTLAVFLREWLKLAEMRLRYSTWSGYRTNIEHHILPTLGDIPVADLKPEHLNALYAELLSNGRVDGTGGLAPRTVQYVRTILRKALKDAMRLGLVDRNVTLLTDSPRSRRPEMRTWAADQVRQFLAHVRNDRYFMAWYLAATTGLRRGELLGLKWRDVDLEGGRLQIRQTLVATGNRIYWSEPKTKGSRRMVAIPEDAVLLLRGHAARQKEEKQRWSGENLGSDVVFTQPDGSPVDPDRFTRWFARHARDAYLPHIRLHDLRHTFATLALEAGIHVKVVSEMLGHDNIVITLDTYSHVMPVIHDEAAAKVSDVIFGKLKKDDGSPLGTDKRDSDQSRPPAAPNDRGFQPPHEEADLGE